MNHSTASLVSNAISTVTPESLNPMTWEGARVITTDLLARLYGTEEIRIQQNFSRNADRFEAGKHFFKLEGGSLKTFKNSLTSSKIVSRARGLILWTERGAARHAKMLETEAAWEVFEKLEDCYFGVAKTAPVLDYTRISPSQAQTLKEYVNRVVASGKQTYGETWARLHRKFRVNSYLELPASQFEEACTYLEAKNFPARYHFPLEAADPHDRQFGNANLTPEVLLDPKNGAPELDLIAQLEREGYNVMGAKMRILAMREAMRFMEDSRKRMTKIYQSLGPVLEICKYGMRESGKNVQFVGKPNPNSAIDRFVFGDQM